LVKLQNNVLFIPAFSDHLRPGQIGSGPSGTQRGHGVILGKKDYYSVLQIAPAATHAEVKASYKRLAFFYHPDRSNHPQSTEQMQLLNEAYEVLSSPEKRAAYDRGRQVANQGTIDVAPPRPEVVVEEPFDLGNQAQAESILNKEKIRRRNAWLRDLLKVFVGLTILVTFQFLWSLLTGQINIFVIFILVLLAVFALISTILRIRNTAV
jgi:hypothetical protein